MLQPIELISTIFPRRWYRLEHIVLILLSLKDAIDILFYSCRYISTFPIIGCMCTDGFLSQFSSWLINWGFKGCHIMAQSETNELKITLDSVYFLVYFLHILRKLGGWSGVDISSGSDIQDNMIMNMQRCRHKDKYQVNLLLIGFSHPCTTSWPTILYVYAEWLISHLQLAQC